MVLELVLSMGRRKGDLLAESQALWMISLPPQPSRPLRARSSLCLSLIFLRIRMLSMAKSTLGSEGLSKWAVSFLRQTFKQEMAQAATSLGSGLDVGEQLAPCTELYFSVDLSSSFRASLLGEVVMDDISWLAGDWSRSARLLCWKQRSLALRRPPFMFSVSLASSSVSALHLARLSPTMLLLAATCWRVRVISSMLRSSSWTSWLLRMMVSSRWNISILRLSVCSSFSYCIRQWWYLALRLQYCSASTCCSIAGVVSVYAISSLWATWIWSSPTSACAHAGTCDWLLIDFYYNRRKPNFPTFPIFSSSFHIIFLRL